MLIDQIKSLKTDKQFMSCVAHWEVIPARPGQYRDFPSEIAADIKNALQKRGITRLYTHQSTCYRLAREGRHLVVVTPTASGKTLCYSLPVLQTLKEHPESKAMYIFPTKALSQDQQSEANELINTGELGIKIFTYDGDTPQSIRLSARQQGQIVITNPDMLHSGILPNHPKWIKFFKSLRYIIIDELHIYRGVFGSHMTNLLRRLKRLLAFYDSRPVFICCSATIGNPQQLAESLLETPVQLVNENGSPAGERHFIFYNPPLVDKVQGIRRGVVLESRALASRFLKAGIKTIVFARSRVRTELIANYIRESLKNFYTNNYNINVASYRGGYLPSERRAIEKGLREGQIHGVVSTNALELGIDIGGLDVSILADFPGSIASCWQQAGRAGRSHDVSVSILVASSSPMSQYIMRHPEYFFTRSPESGWVDANNMYILIDQLKCALFELPFNDGEGFKDDVTELLCFLEEHGVIRHTAGKWYWSDRSYPAEKVSLRTATTENVVIIDTTKGRNKVIGEMDRPSAKMLLFDKAIYLHAGNQFQVKQLDIENKKCYVEEADVNYYTDSVVKSDIKLLHKDSEERLCKIKMLTGDILVRTAVTKFKKLKFMTHENIGYGEINLPEEEMHTRSVILIFDESLPPGECFGRLPENAKGMVLKAAGFLIQQVAPLFLLCDARDLGIAERIKEPGIEQPCIYVYDTYPGGSGLADGFRYNAGQIMAACLEVVRECECAYGCPACIGPPEEKETDFNAKPAITDLLASIFRE